VQKFYGESEVTFTQIPEVWDLNPCICTPPMTCKTCDEYQAKKIIVKNFGKVPQKYPPLKTISNICVSGGINVFN